MENNNPSNINRIAIYVMHDRDGILDGFRKYFLLEIRKFTKRIVVVVNGFITPQDKIELENIVDDIFIRENIGFLAYSWIDGINYIGEELYQYDELLLLNDNFFGPFFPLENVFSKMIKSNADFYSILHNSENFDSNQKKYDDFDLSTIYFYVIRNKLLHSHAFREYWNSKPKILSEQQSHYFCNIKFINHIRNSGYLIDSFQSNNLERYSYNNHFHNMYKLLINDNIPFVLILPFCSDIKSQSLSINYCNDPRQTLEYIDKHTDYDVNLIWDYILRTANLTNIYNQLELQYIVSKDNLDKPFNYNKKIAVILHIYYEDAVEEIADYCLNFLPNTDFFITTTSDNTEKTIINVFNKLNLKYTLKIKPNIGLAISTLWITYSDIVLSDKYEYICYFHDKKSPYSYYSSQGELFATRLFENLIGTKEIIKNIINLFEDNSKLGMLGIPIVYHDQYFLSAANTWNINYQNTVDLSIKLGINVNIDPDIVPVAPYGDMFWFRSKALKKVIGTNFTYEDFKNAIIRDGTILHAIERLYGFAVQDSGYYYAEVLNSENAKTDLLNYKYIVNVFCKNIINKEYFSSNFLSAKFYFSLKDPKRYINKRKIKLFFMKITPKILLKIFKNIFKY
jgi:rhamnosyltransferase